MEPIVDSAINIVSEGSQLEGKITFDQITRIHGILKGEIHAKAGSTLILSETGVIEGNVQADTLIIDGYIKGEVHAHSRVVISGTGRVIGNINSPKLVVEFGAHFDGKSVMEGLLTGGHSIVPA